MIMAPEPPMSAPANESPCYSVPTVARKGRPVHRSLALLTSQSYRIAPCEIRATNISSVGRRRFVSRPRENHVSPSLTGLLWDFQSPG